MSQRIASRPQPVPFPAGYLQHQLVARGVRMTRQRRAILHVIETAGRHLDAAQILARAVRLDASINRVTVYRTLWLLKRHGLVYELDLMHIRGDAHYYEPRPPRDHMHITCVRCGSTVEFESPMFERLKGQIGRECRFQITTARLEIGGLCARCRRRPAPSAAPGPEEN